MNDNFNPDNNFNLDNNFNPGQPLFNNEKTVLPDFNEVKQMQQFQNEEIDIPPQIADIEELNSLSQNTIPTPSGLDPMNLISDEVVNNINNGFNNNDILNSYDHMNNNFTNMSPENNEYAPMPDLENMKKVDEYNNYSKPVDFSNISNMSPENNEYAPMSDLGNMKKVDEYNNYSKPVDFSNISNMSPENNEYALVSDLENDSNKENSIDNNSNQEDLTDNDTSSTTDVSQKEDSSSPDEINTKEDDVNYSIENKSLNQEEDDTINDINEELYNEPDTLEIMDIDTPEEENENNNDVKSIVEKINLFINELKEENTDADIKTEKFDFEDMIQIVIKIKK